MKKIHTLGKYFSTDPLISVKWRIFGWNGFWDTHIKSWIFYESQRIYLIHDKFDISVQELNNISPVQQANKIYKFESLMYLTILHEQKT